MAARAGGVGYGELNHFVAAGHLGRCAIGSSSAGRSRPPGRRRCCIPGYRRHSVARERATLDSRRAAICLVAWHPCDEKVGESYQDVLMLKLACHDERKAFPVGFVDDDEEPEFAAVVGPSLDEIIGTDARRDGLRGVRRRPCDRRRRGRQGRCRLSGLRPLALGCGGTKPTASCTSITDETVWKSNGGGTGGGVSGLSPLPACQKGVGVPASTAKAGGRGMPEIEGDADPTAAIAS